MSEASEPVRTMEDVQKDYGQTCGLLGDIEYRIHTLMDQALILKGKLKSLNHEGALMIKDQKPEVTQ